MSDWYDLDDDHNVLGPFSTDEYLARAANRDPLWRQVARSEVGEVKVSTVFLALDHGWEAGAAPVVFETMIFGGAHSDDQWRCSTWAEAEAQHTAAVALVEAGGKGDDS